MKQDLNGRHGWYGLLVSGSGGGEQISLEVSSEGVDRWCCRALAVW